MKRDLFGTDGVRGLAGQYPLDTAGAEQIGRAIGMQFAQPGDRVVIGCDPRESSAQIVADVSAGLNAVGIDVVQAGVLPTPGIAYLTREHNEFVAGVMITASHNPYQYNGIKVFDRRGDKLSDDTEATLNQLIDSDIAERGMGGVDSNPRLINEYEDFLVHSAPGLHLHNIRLAIDSANGAASGLAERVFTRLGAEVSVLSAKPDGKNINADCGATYTQPLQDIVQRDGLALGIALDGDADRLIMADDQGREVKGDYLLYLLAVNGFQPGVVATVMSNLGFELALRKKGIKLERTQVGDRYVLEGLEKTGFRLGGEQSGHIILPDLLKTGDALLAAVQVAQALNVSGRTLANWCDEVELLPQALVNISLQNAALLDEPAVKTFIAAQTEQLGTTGRLLIRPSGTEPLARVMVEAPDAQATAERIAAQLQAILKT
jgi:phosphoglucosamine mutase